MTSATTTAYQLCNSCAVAVAYAARHPDKVTHLILCGAYARGRAVRAMNDDEKRAAALDLDLARVGWGRDDPAFRQVFAAQFLPDGTRADWEAFDHLQRRTTSPENAVRFLDEFGRIDVRDLARQVACPTLIMHSADDHRVPMRYGEELAALIGSAQALVVPSRYEGFSLPAVEAMIDEYIDKYNLPHRLKRAYDAMMQAVEKGLNEAELMEQLSDNESTLARLKEEIDELQKRQQKGFDTAAYQARMEREGKALPPATEEQLIELEGAKEEELRKLAATFMGQQEVSESIARERVAIAENQLQFHHQKLVNDYENLFELTQGLIREDLKQEYRHYIEELFENTEHLELPILEGVRKTVGDISFNLSVTQNDIQERDVVVGSEEVSISRWYKPWSWGKSKTVEIYGQEKYVDLEALWQERSVLIETEFNALIQGARQQINSGQKRLVEQYIAFMTREFDREFGKLLDSLQEKLDDSEARELAIEDARQQRDQIRTLKSKLDAILAI